MTHFLHRAESVFPRALRRPHVGVAVEVIKQRPKAVLRIDSERGVFLVSPRTHFVQLPDRVEVHGTDGEAIPPTDTFYISVGTLDPSHIVMDVSQTDLF